AELAWDAAINPIGIGVIARDGVVTLTGHLDTFAEKRAVERAVRRVSGVRGIALELDVKLSAEHQRSDSEIAQAASSALRWSSLVPSTLSILEILSTTTAHTQRAMGCCTSGKPFSPQSA
ncbi:BON domain-containing protein, partial [Polaromonas sp.]|uniref:BON domain-containing protein n=1 Tax=Polaromonas sp. TaxID=1869339 RepID=UPI0035242B18